MFPHSAIGGFDVPRESRGIHQGRSGELLANCVTVRMMSGGGDLDELLGRISDQSGMPAVVRMLKPAQPEPLAAQATTGTPIHNASSVVVMPL